MNLSDSIVPKSDQLNAEDLLSGPKTVTIEKVTAGNSEQPVNVHLVETPGRPYRPSKTMRRVMVACWGPDAALYVGRRMTLYRDPTVKFGGMAVGGIKISHLSHIDKRTTLALTETRGKRAPHVVEPLPDAPAPVDWQAEIEACAGDRDALRALWERAKGAQAGPVVAEAIRAASNAAQAVSDPEPVDEQPVAAPAALVAKLKRQLGDLDVAKPAEQLKIVSQIAGRRIASWGDLTTQEGAHAADQLVRVLQAEQPGRALDALLGELADDRDGGS